MAAGDTHRASGDQVVDRKQLLENIAVLGMPALLLGECQKIRPCPIAFVVPKGSSTFMLAAGCLR